MVRWNSFNRLKRPFIIKKLRVELTLPLKIILERRPVIYDYFPEAVGLPEYVRAAILLEKAA